MDARRVMQRSIFAAAIAGALLALAAGAEAAPNVPAYAVTGQIAGPDGGFDYVSFDPAVRRLFVSRSDGLDALDVDSGAYHPHFADGASTHEPLVIDHGDHVLLTNRGDSSAHLLDASTGALLVAIPTAAKPDGAAYDPQSGVALVTTHSAAVTLIDTRGRKPIADVAVGGSPEFPAMDDHGRAYVDIEDKNEIVVIDLAAKTVVAHYALAGCDGPSGLAYDAQTGLLIASCGNNVAKVLRAADGHEVASLAIGKGPDAVILDAARRLAFIPCGWDGVMNVIALRGPNDAAVVATVTTQRGARTGAVDPKTGKIYLPTATYTLPAGGGRPVPTPGTFKILVVSPQ